MKKGVRINGVPSSLKYRDFNKEKTSRVNDCLLTSFLRNYFFNFLIFAFVTFNILLFKVSIQILNRVPAAGVCICSSLTL